MSFNAKYIKAKNPIFTWQKYSHNNRIALCMGDTILSVNLPEAALPDGHIFIKDYSEHEGVLNELVRLKIVSKPVGHVATGYVLVAYCKITDPGYEEWLRATEKLGLK